MTGDQTITFTKATSVMARQNGTKKKTDGMYEAIDDSRRDPIAKIDWFHDVEKKISSLVATKQLMKAVAIDVKKIAGEAEQLRWENAKMMVEKLWEYLADEESAGAVIETS